MLCSASEDEEPFCLDMATSVVTFNKIRQLREEKNRLRQVLEPIRKALKRRIRMK